jgi:TPP-dependent pyruvate/acetoin dehydrogenase alpha subunit
VEKQTAAPTLALKAHGYGLVGVRVDGNDALAVCRVVRAAAEHARKGGIPVLIEALTYRVGAHSTSDDPSRYRDEAVTRQWAALDPIERLQRYLLQRGAIGAGEVEAMRQFYDDEVRTTLAEVEQIPPVALPTLFEDVFAEMPAHLSAQLAELQALQSAAQE